MSNLIPKIWVLWRLYYHCWHGDPCLVQVNEYNLIANTVAFNLNISEENDKGITPVKGMKELLMCKE